MCDDVAGEALEATRLRRVLHCVSVPGATQASLGMPQASARHDKRDDGRYEGELKTLSVRADITLLPIGDKASPSQPDYRVMSQGIEIGAGWIRTGQISGKEYVSLSISAPELGSKTLYANLGRAAGQTDPDVYALIWNPQD